MIDFINDDIRSIVKNAGYDELDDICDEIRRFILESVSVTGGHLASNLGVVEMTVALHRVYDTPGDKIIFDVGHQSYTHKILTGRASEFGTLRKYGGLSGFPKSNESDHDAYDTGHSTTSISAAAGMAVAREIKGEDNHIVAVIGDGSMTGGLAYEALNNIGSTGTNVKIILNDNGMSIARNVGALPSHLRHLRSSSNYFKAKSTVKSTLNKVPVVGKPLAGGISRTKDHLKYSIIGDQGILFEDLGIKYIGPVDGYDIAEMEAAFLTANEYEGPTLVHVITVKGKGYEFSEKYPRKYHGVGPFNINDGISLSSTDSKTFSQIFGETATELARKNDSIVTVAAAMGTATGLGTFYDAFPDRYFDVGIAEEHAVVFAAGLAKSGLVPVVAIYSSFLQRAIDQIIEDVCLQNLHVIFAIDRAGLVGADGETHHGQFDLSYLSMIPNITVLAPADGNQLIEMMEYALTIDGPVAIRYPRANADGDHLRMKRFTGQNISLNEGRDVTILAVGNMLDEVLESADAIRRKGYDAGVISVGIVKPFDNDLTDIASDLVITIEDNVYSGGFGQAFRAASSAKPYKVVSIAIPDRFVTHGSVDELRKECGMTADDITKEALSHLEGKA